ncbi:hypothetical protein SASPL_133409 [Salvia splendens]|uniref:Uncharacterized protein n=1 Tax=Salvia splendens TaxID=180675 RepID=A0A8X8X4V3_SALSN|nr:hypothetical protein SASPL_133409 [Salvia splendens]
MFDQAPKASAAPKKVVKVTYSTSSVVTGGLDGLPREDTGILSDVLKCLGDNRKHMREFTLSTLDTWPCAAHPNKMNNYESGEFVSSSITLESSLKTAKSNGNGDRESQHGSRNAPSRVVPNKGFKQESILSFQDINIQSQQGWFTFILSGNKDGRERIIVRRFKLDELRVEEIQDLERVLIGRSAWNLLEEVNKRVLLDGTDNYESGGYVLLSITAESILKTAKPNGHGYRESWHESRNAPSELAPNKGSMQESILSIEDIDIQSRVLISKDDREMIIVCRFKFEELHIERIQDLQFSF